MRSLRRAGGCWAIAALAGCQPSEQPSPPVPGTTEATMPADQVKPAPGGQSGVEGQTPRPPMQAPGPGIPGGGCDPHETTLADGDPSVFGATTAELLAAFSHAATPLHWVAYDAPLAGTRYHPGPGETAVAITLARGAGEVLQWKSGPDATGGDYCRTSELQIPVQVDLTTADGMLDEHFDSTLHVASGYHAELSHDLPASALGGDFQVLEAGTRNAGERWELEALSIDIMLWRGGSSGAIHPMFMLLNPPDVATPPQAGAPTPASTPDSQVPLPEVPDRYFQLALWPTPLLCRGERALSADAPVIGSSARDVLATEARFADWALMGDDWLPIHFERQPVPDVLCLSVSDDELAFTSVARVSVDTERLADAHEESDAGAPVDAGLRGLDAQVPFEWQARADVVSGDITRVRFVRQGAGYTRTRQGLEVETGLELPAPDEYQQFWWAFFGQLQGTDDIQGGLSVHALNAEQMAEVDRIRAQGGPGAGTSRAMDTGFPEFPGDSLLDLVLIRE